MSDDVQPEAATDTTPADEVRPDAEAVDTDADSFPRDYVQKLRKESAGYRDKAKAAEERADAHSRRLFTELVRATSKLTDPRDMPYDAALLEDVDLLDVAIEALIADRPHLRARKIVGDVGQGQRGSHADAPSFADLLRP